MRLRRLRLQNFRQHVESELVFSAGLTGIIGPNGAGKSTILEAIAWALYGSHTVRGGSDSLRFARAAPRAAVRVELEFDLAGHRYRVVRGLTMAELFLDDGPTPIANAVSTVTELLQRRIGMTRTEFFNTYFTGQKELAVMQALSSSERAQFLSRVLGYERLRLAQDACGLRRRDLTHEIAGLRAGLPDRAAVEVAVGEAEATLAGAEDAWRAATEAVATTKTALDAVAPQWLAAQQGREARQRLETEQATLDGELVAVTRELERLTLEQTTQERRLAEVDPTAAEATPADRRERVAALQAAIATQRAELATLEEEITQRRTTWVREQQEVETRLRTLRAQYAELRDQRDRLLSLGEDGDCPTCTRPLGTHYRDVLDLLERQMETVEADGAYFRSRQGQLQEMPEELATREARRRTMREQGEVAEDHRAQLEGILDRLERVVREVAERSARRTTLQARREETAGRLIALGPPSADDTALRERHEACAAAFAQASTRAAGAQATREMAGAALTRARAERAAVEERLARVETLEQERILHDELHRTYSDLRTDLNYALRPELSEIASRLLSELTDARYTELELDDRYRLVVLEEGVPKPVISGGEEDVANLVLRLAISQMIAERAGQAFSLLILDEIFGSLDAQRRDAVLALLRGLQARFEQVIVISHIDDVRDGLDQVFSVGFDPETGAAVVTAAEGPRLGSLPLAEMVG